MSQGDGQIFVDFSRKGLAAGRTVLKWVAVITVIGLLGACATRPTLERADCVVDQALPWLAEHWGDPGDRKPRIAIVSQEVLASMPGATAMQGFHIYGLSVGDNVLLWDGLNLSTWDGQMVLVHELAHWVDTQLGRKSEHRDVYLIAEAWARDTGGVDCSNIG